MQPLRSSAAFTIVELLVTITVIVILLAMIVPAMDTAVYRAELAACGANLKGIGQGAIMYATDHRRVYPQRLASPDTGWRANRLTGISTQARFDVRSVIRRYIPINLALVDPLCRRVDLESIDSNSSAFSSYNLWFGWQIAGGKRMNRLGDRLTYGDESFSVLAADLDTMHFSQPWTQASHPDDEQLLQSETLRDEITFSIWLRSGSSSRGRIDRNFVMDDLGVSRYDKVLSHNVNVADPRMAPVSARADDADATIRDYLPKR